MSRHNFCPDENSTPDWPTCGCCGTELPEDGSFCAACDAMECGEQDVGSPCKWSGDLDRLDFNNRHAAKAVTPLTTAREFAAETERLLNEKTKREWFRLGVKFSLWEIMPDATDAERDAVIEKLLRDYDAALGGKAVTP